MAALVLTASLGGLAASESASLGQKVGVWTERIAFATSSASTILNDQRDFITDKFGERGVNFLNNFDKLQGVIIW